MFNQYNPYINYKVNRFSFNNILNNTQKFLNIANQALPIVKEVRPIIKNARTLFKVAKGFNSINNEEKIEKPKKVDTNGLNFFI